MFFRMFFVALAAVDVTCFFFFAPLASANVPCFFFAFLREYLPELTFRVFFFAAIRPKIMQHDFSRSAKKKTCHGQIKNSCHVKPCWSPGVFATKSHPDRRVFFLRPAFLFPGSFCNPTYSIAGGAPQIALACQYGRRPIPSSLEHSAFALAYQTGRHP